MQRRPHGDAAAASATARHRECQQTCDAAHRPRRPARPRRGRRSRHLQMLAGAPYAPQAGCHLLTRKQAAAPVRRATVACALPYIGLAHVSRRRGHRTYFGERGRATEAVVSIATVWGDVNAFLRPVGIRRASDDTCGRHHSLHHRRRPRNVRATQCTSCAHGLSSDVGVAG